jgi:hypothetical protein
MDYPHEDWCLLWPFARDKHGRGLMSAEGIHYWAHRYMCKLVKGDPPTPEHTAAHSCGNGHEGCINPHHLAWKTQAENLEDCRKHGTIVRTLQGNKGRLLPMQVREIRDARGYQTQGQLAAKYGVSEGTISDIWHRRTYRDGSKINHWRPEEDEHLLRALSRGESFEQAVAELPDRTWKAAKQRSERLKMNRS